MFITSSAINKLDCLSGVTQKISSTFKGCKRSLISVTSPRNFLLSSLSKKSPSTLSFFTSSWQSFSLPTRAAIRKLRGYQNRSKFNQEVYLYRRFRNWLLTNFTNHIFLKSIMNCNWNLLIDIPPVTRVLQSNRWVHGTFSRQKMNQNSLLLNDCVCYQSYLAWILAWRNFSINRLFRFYFTFFNGVIMK